MGLSMRLLGLLYNMGAGLSKRESPVEAISISMDLALKIMQFSSCHILFLKELTESHLVQGRKNRLSLGEVCQSPDRAGGARNVAVPVLGKYNLP